MSVATDWFWGQLTPEQLAFAEAVCVRELENVQRLRLGQGRYSHTPDERYQKQLGAEGEVAFRVLTGRPLPTVEAMTSTWKGADVDGFAVKTVSQPGYRLVFDGSDLVPAKALVLVYNAAPRFAIIGRIGVTRARMVRTWSGRGLPRPAWVIEQEELDPWWE